MAGSKNVVAESYGKENMKPGTVSATGFVSYLQLLEGCTILINRCHDDFCIDGMKFELVETVGKTLYYLGEKSLPEFCPLLNGAAVLIFTTVC